MASLLKNIPIGKLLDAARDMSGTADKAVRVSVCVDLSVPKEAIEAVKQVFDSTSPNCAITVAGFDDQAYEVDPAADLLVVVVNDSPAVSRTVATAVVADVPAVVCALDSKRVFEQSKGTSFPLEADDIIDLDAANGFEDFPGDLADWIVSNCPETKTAFAAAFPFIRKPLCFDITQKTAVACGAVGAVPLIPGADMPVMLLLQGKMILEMAAAYGRPLTRDSIIEMASAIPMGLGARGVARVLAKRVRFLSFVTNGAVAFSSTMALGHLMNSYFERGGLPEGVVTVLRDLEDKVGDLGGGMVGTALEQVANLGENAGIDSGTEKDEALSFFTGTDAWEGAVR